MKLFGHPFHLMLIHFPSALLPMEFVFYVLFYFTRKASYGEIAFYALMGAVVIGWIAICFGLMDLVNISSDKSRAQKRAFIHGGLNTTVIMSYSILLFIAFKAFPDLSTSLSILIIKAVLLIILVVGNYLGGQLVLKYHIGIENDGKP